MVETVEGTREATKKLSKWWVTVIGVGLALSPIHNQWLTSIASNSKGETLFFLPTFGYLLILMGSGLFLLNRWKQVKDTGWGDNDKGIVICLAVIATAMSISGIFAYSSIEDKIAPTGMGLALVGLYLCGRVLGQSLFLPLAIGAAIASVGVLAYQVAYPTTVTGGFVFEDNYDVIIGYALLGTSLFIHRWQWLLAGLSVPAMLLTGSPEGLFVLGVLGLVALLRRDYGKRLVIASIPLIVIAVVAITSGFGQELYRYAFDIVSGKETSPFGDEDKQPVNAVTYRLYVIKEAMMHIKPMGDGYNLTDFGRSPNVHNVPLVIVQQLGYPGILAALAWLWVSVWCLVKTKWKYVWVSILALSVFDHFIFTQLAPFWPAIVGASTTSTIASDMMFKKKEAAA